MVDSLAVIDQVLKRDLPQGPCWRRYNHDGYGQKADGSAYDGTGEGRCWPILTGERAHYELAAGRDPLPFIEALEKFANAGGMLPEQAWDADDLPEGKMKRGGPTGAAMPLCWAHAEYITLVRSQKDRACFERIEPVYDRYVKNKLESRCEIWTFAHQLRSIASGKTLRIIAGAPVTVHWSSDGWASTHDTEAVETSLGCWFVDLPWESLEAAREIVFTFHWQQTWEGKDFRVQIEETP